MTHTEIIKKFIEVYPICTDEIKCWFPSGKNCIRIRTFAYGEIMFTYKSKKEWRIESVDSYLNSIKVEVQK